MDKLAIGKLCSTFGIGGDLKFQSYSGESEHVEALVGQSVEVVDDASGNRSILVVEEVSSNSSGLLMRFKGWDRPEAVRKLVGRSVYVEASKAAPKAPGEHYIGELVGCSLLSGGKVLATVLSVLDGAQAALLEVELGNGERRLVPFMNAYLGKVDCEAKTIELTAPWILE